MLPAIADVHIDQRIVLGLRQQGMDIVSAQERGWDRIDDEALLQEAIREGRLLLTNDTDFQAIAKKCQQQGQTFAPIMFWPQNRRSIGYLIDAIIRFALQNKYDECCSLVHFL